MARRKPRNQSGLGQENECVEYSNQSSLHVNEEGVGATFVNRRGRELRKVKYDGCYCRIPREGRADFIIGYDRAIDVVLELKGSDLKHALVQIADTLERWKKGQIHYPQVACLIVYGHTIPRMRSKIGVLEREFLDQHSILLTIRQSGKERYSLDRKSVV